MCGIFGIVSLEQETQAAFVALAELNKARGNRGFGGLWGDGGALVPFRQPQPFDPTLVPAQAARVQLGHIRAPTGRQSTAVTDVHPFSAPCGWLAHNGLLLNHEQFPQWQLDTAVMVDSAFILGGIQAHVAAGLALPMAIRQTVEKLQGQQACWLWARPQGALYLWRVMAPVYIGHGHGRFVFSSVKHETAYERLAEGVIFRLDPHNLTFAACETFSFYSPYRA